MAGASSPFPQTIWKRLKEAAGQKTTAVNDFVLGYEPPLRKFILSSGISEAEVDDLLQEVLLELFQKNLLWIADERKGRFRSFLLGVTKNAIRAWRKKAASVKRTGGTRTISLDDTARPDGESPLSDFLAAPDQDKTFDSLWVDHLMRRAFEQLRIECELKSLPYYEALRQYFYDRDASYASIAVRMNVSEPQVTNYIHRGKKKLIEFIRAEIATYCSSEQEFGEELRYLATFFKPLS